MSFRSGLRELAEGLLRTAQTERAYGEIERQLQLHKGDIWGTAVEGAGQHIAGGVARMLAPDEVDTELGERILGVLPGEIQQTEKAIGQLRGLGAAPEDIERLEGLLAAQRQVFTMPLQQVPGAYDQLMNTDWGLGVPGALAIPLGEGAVARLQGLAPYHQALATQVLKSLSFNPGDPDEVAQAYMSLDLMDSLPDDVAGILRPAMDAVTTAFNQNPLAQQAYNDAMRLRQAAIATAESGAEKAEIDVLRAQEELDHARRMNPTAYRQAIANLGTTEQQLVGTALRTGNLTGLDKDLQGALARYLGTQPQDLAAWSQQRIAEHQERESLETDYLRLRNQNLQQTYVIGTQTIQANDLQYAQDTWGYSQDLIHAIRDNERWEREQVLWGREDTEYANTLKRWEREEWSHNRERFLAPIQDEERIAGGIAGAIRNNDVALLNFYMHAFMDPSSAVGAQMRELMPPDTMEDLRAAHARALELQEIDMRMLQYDEQSRESAAEMARLKLEQFRVVGPIETAEAVARHELLPLEIEALRLGFQRDKAEIDAFLARLPLREAQQAVGALGEIARALPPEFWDDPPPYVTDALARFGMTVEPFAAISRLEQWLNAEPVRAAAWDQLKYLSQAAPQSPEDMESILDGAMAAIQSMGLTPEGERALFTATQMLLMENDMLLKNRLLQLSAEAAGGTDVKRALDGFSSLSTSLRQEYADVWPQRIMNSKCGLPINVSVLGAGLVQWTEAKLGQQADGEEPGVTCGKLRDEYNALGERIARVNNIQEELANILGVEYEVGTGRTPAPAPPPPPATGADDAGVGQGVFNPAERLRSAGNIYAPQTPLEREVTPEHQQMFNTAVVALVDGDRAGFERVANELHALGYSQAQIIRILRNLGVSFPEE